MKIPRHPKTIRTPAIAVEGTMNMLRKIQCKLGLCGGHIEHVRDENGVWWIGLRCTATGTLHHPVKSAFQGGNDLCGGPLFPVVNLQ